MRKASNFTIRPAEPGDVPALHGLIVELAIFEKLEHLVVATEADLHDGLFGTRPSAEALVGLEGEEVVCFALYYHNFSTFLGRRGLFLEDLYVKQAHRGKGYGRQLLIGLAQQAIERKCGRFEWAVLDWNMQAINFYREMGAELMQDWRICRVSGPALRRLAER